MQHTVWLFFCTDHANRGIRGTPMKTLALSEVQLVETYKQTLLFENDLEKHVGHDPNVCAIRQIQQTC